MHLERASLYPPPGLRELLLELGDGEAGFSGTSFGRGEVDLQTFLRECCDGEDPTRLKAGLVPQIVYWMIGDANDVVGTIRVRPRLNDRLLQNGGNVGYYVRRAERGKGYAKQALRLSLDRLREFSVTRALLTVNPSNLASIRVVLANGGLLDDEAGVDQATGSALHRYWINLIPTVSG
jgi:predicted acetyltransferase